MIYIGSEKIGEIKTLEMEAMDLKMQQNGMKKMKGKMVIEAIERGLVEGKQREAMTVEEWMGWAGNIYFFPEIIK